jgi:riboflavin biosynthesis pyrimidine reductase
MAQQPPDRFSAGSIGSVSNVAAHRVDRLWPDPAADLELDAAFADLTLPEPPPGRPLVGVNMVTTIDGRAQLGGAAEGLASRTDRRLMRLLRVPYAAVGSGVGTLRASGGLWLHVPPELSERRQARGLPPQPTQVVIAGSGDVPLDVNWFRRPDPRILFVGSRYAGPQPPGTELLVAPTERPEPQWVLERLAERGLGSLLLEGGPSTNAAFLAVDAIDELYWTIGAGLLGTDALQMIAPIPDGSPWADAPRPATLVSVFRHGNELFLRYRLPATGEGD